MLDSQGSSSITMTGHTRTTWLSIYISWLPGYIRSIKRLGVKILFIQPASPWKNGHNESFHGKLKDELLNG
jgi:transposase InsO family protein